MFEVEELFDLTKEGAFASVQEFKDFAAEASTSDLYSILKPGAFESPEQLNSLIKKKRRYGIKWRGWFIGITYHYD